jgi:putative tryptophan/tyrosine transport system substrate-binding protein
VTLIARRRLLAGAGVLLAAPPAWAQRRSRRVAWLGAGRADTPSPFLGAFRAGMRDLGWEDDRNLELSTFWTEGSPADAERLARQMLATSPEVVVVYGRDVLAVHAVKPTVPVVFAFSGDPVDAGIVHTFARPGINFTGLTFMSLDLVGKRVEFLREAVPHIRRLAVLARPEHPGEQRERAASEEVARRLKIALAYIAYQEATGIEGALQAIAHERCDALVAFPDGVMLANSRRIAAFAAEARMAAVSGWDSFADSGFLLTFGPNLHDSYRGLARYVDRILRGARPEELPVELPRTVELVVNLRTARTLGLTIPDSLRLRAHRLIE